MKNKFYISEFRNYIAGNRTLTNIFIGVSFLFVGLVILFFNFFIDAFFSFNEEDYKVGEPAKRDYIIKSDFDYYNVYETKQAKSVEEQLVLPVYKIDNDISIKVLSEFNIFSKSINNLGDNPDQTLIFEIFNSSLQGVFTESEIVDLFEIDINLFLKLTLEQLEKLLDRGYISDSGEVALNGSGLISVLSAVEGEDSSETISALSVLRSTESYNSIPAEYQPYLNKMVNSFIQVNCFYDNIQTKHNKELALEKVEPIIDHYRKGDLLIKEDIVVSSDIYSRILDVEAQVKKNTFSNILLVFGYILLIYCAAFVLFTDSFIQRKLRDSDVILITSLTMIHTVITVLVRYFLDDGYWYLYPMIIPTVLISMLMTFLLGNRVGFYLSVLFSFLILLISDFSIYTFAITLIISILSTIIIHDVDKRIDLLKSSAQLALLQTVLVLFTIFTGAVQNYDLFMLILVSFSSSIFYGILTLAILPLSEHWLKISTSFQLAELCDLNAPVLKSMLIKAPGTYAHSIAVANMAESAAQHIGANALLAKAGGYYHDIGKIDQPLYFIENQKGGKNLHDEMKPSLSVAVLKSHVKLGIEKAKNIGLPVEIIDIIQQHHGKGYIAFFLDKAQKENKGGIVNTEDFAYSGPNPGSPEAAIVLLADSVEAAVRSLKNPTISQLEKFVWDLILGKLNNGMLDACGLTLSDLTTIKDSFISTLMGHYHSRIEYPNAEKINNE